MRQVSCLLPAILVGGPALLVGCVGAPKDNGPSTFEASYDLGVSSDPASVQVAWKERLGQPYLFLEHRGDYRDLGSAIGQAIERAEAAGIQVVGPPFGLFFDDPGAIDVSELRSRACVPVAGTVLPPDGLGRDLLPRAMVAYAVVAGAHADAPACYPGIFRFLSENGWVRQGPVREIYLMPGGGAGVGSVRRTEVQIPWVPGR